MANYSDSAVAVIKLDEIDGSTRTPAHVSMMLKLMVLGELKTLLAADGSPPVYHKEQVIGRLSEAVKKAEEEFESQQGKPTTLPNKIVIDLSTEIEGFFSSAAVETGIKQR